MSQTLNQISEPQANQDKPRESDAPIMTFMN
ncbi:hypothetical protein SHVI106290_00810 [Shewanella violacea]